MDPATECCTTDPSAGLQCNSPQTCNGDKGSCGEQGGSWYHAVGKHRPYRAVACTGMLMLRRSACSVLRGAQVEHLSPGVLQWPVALQLMSLPVAPLPFPPRSLPHAWRGAVWVGVHRLDHPVLPNPVHPGHHLHPAADVQRRWGLVW